LTHNPLHIDRSNITYLLYKFTLKSSVKCLLRSKCFESKSKETKIRDKKRNMDSERMPSGAVGLPPSN
jgi:hypothetical protein